MLFDGTLDEVAIYGTVLSSERLQAHFAAAIPEPGALALLGLGLLALSRRGRRGQR